MMPDADLTAESLYVRSKLGQIEGTLIAHDNRFDREAQLVKDHVASINMRFDEFKTHLDRQDQTLDQIRGQILSWRGGWFALTGVAGAVLGILGVIMGSGWRPFH